MTLPGEILGYIKRPSIEIKLITTLLFKCLSLDGRETPTLRDTLELSLSFRRKKVLLVTVQEPNVIVYSMMKDYVPTANLRIFSQLMIFFEPFPDTVQQVVRYCVETIRTSFQDDKQHLPRLCLQTATGGSLQICRCILIGPAYLI